jgi:hypothetical protein
MFVNPRYIQNSYTINFQRQPRVRRKANDIEDFINSQLGNHYSQPEVIPVPDEIDPIVPRLIFGSIHGFSQIILTQINISINVNYSPDWQVNIELGKDYLKHRVAVLYDLVTNILDSKALFSGLVTRLHVFNNNRDDNLEYLSSILLHDSLRSEHIHDIEQKITTVYNNSFFSNLFIRNLRLLEMNKAIEIIPRLPDNKCKTSGVEIIGDFTDRYSYNENRRYYSSPSVAAGIIDSGVSEIQRAISMLVG